MSEYCILSEEKLYIKVIKTKLEKNIAITKVNQSVNKEMFTVTFFTYEATNETTR